MLRMTSLILFFLGLVQATFAQERVIIIGAGISGLAAGKTLQKSGYEAVILEARDRVGGKIWTERSTGSSLYLGASWIHAITGNPITSLAKKST